MNRAQRSVSSRLEAKPTSDRDGPPEPAIVNVVERFQTPFVMAGIGVGLAALQVPGVSALADRLVLPFLLVMLFGRSRPCSR